MLRLSIVINSFYSLLIKEQKNLMTDNLDFNNYLITL